MALYVGIDLHSNNSYVGFWTPAFDKIGLSGRLRRKNRINGGANLVPSP